MRRMIDNIHVQVRKCEVGGWVKDAFSVKVWLVVE